MREKILAELVKKFPGLQKEFLGFIAEKLSAKVTEENQIEGAINELDSLTISIPDQAAFFQKEGDRRVTEAKKKFELEIKPPQPPKPAGGEPPKPEPAPEDETKKMIRELGEKLDRLEKEKESDKVRNTFQQKMKDKKLPSAFFKGRTVEKEEDIDALVTEIENDYNEFVQEQTNGELGTLRKPAGSKAEQTGKTSALMNDYLKEKETKKN